MALITSLEYTTKERNSVHRPVDCSYTVFTDADGKRYLQLDTFGTEDRQIKGKVSQSIQLDAIAATELKRIIEEEIL